MTAHRDPETFPEMEVLRTQRRLYPQEGLAAHVIGYVGEVSEAELDSPEFIKYDQGDVVGKAGIERQYNDTLMGKDGQRQVVVDNRGNEHEVASIKEAVPGKSLQLTLDLDLQVVAELAMQGRNGAVVALDPRNGEVLAMVSNPTYDPNKFAGRIRTEDWKEIASNPDNPMLDRAVRAGVHFQADHGAGGPGEGRDRRRFQGPLSRRRHVLRALLQVLGEVGSWGGGAAQGHRPFLRCVLL